MVRGKTDLGVTKLPLKKNNNKYSSNLNGDRLSSSFARNRFSNATTQRCFHRSNNNTIPSHPPRLNKIRTIFSNRDYFQTQESRAFNGRRRYGGGRSGQTEAGRPNARNPYSPPAIFDTINRIYNYRTTTYGQPDGRAARPRRTFKRVDCARKSVDVDDRRFFTNAFFLSVRTVADGVFRPAGTWGTYGHVVFIRERYESDGRALGPVIIISKRPRAKTKPDRIARRPPRPAGFAFRPSPAERRRVL